MGNVIRLSERDGRALMAKIGRPLPTERQIHAMAIEIFERKLAEAVAAEDPIGAAFRAIESALGLEAQS